MSPYSYQSSLKSRRSDELINIWLLRPVAGWVVRLVYNTPITPNHLTFASIVLGLAAAWCISYDSTALSAAAAILIEIKDVLDSADGQLARAKHLSSRRGRFYDSLGDVVVDAALFAGIMAHFRHEPSVVVLALAGFAGMTLRVSHHVYCQVMYLHLENKYEMNRPQESLTAADLSGDSVARTLQRLHLIIYGWQDQLMDSLDRWCLGKNGEAGVAGNPEMAARWYGDTIGLRLSGLVGLGTELAVLALCTLLQSLPLYLLLNLFLMNGIFILSILYRKLFLSRTLKVSFNNG